MSPIVWLASYPKCGNTWFRLILANLARDQPAPINEIASDGGVASARRRFDDAFLIDSGVLTHDECDRMRPALYRTIAARGRGVPASHRVGLALDDVQFIKSHDAWLRNSDGDWLLGGRDVARGAILIVRDPRDVVASLANHLNRPLDSAIDFMTNRDMAFAQRGDRQHLQLRQRLLDWSGFYASWLDQDELPVHLVRYEDMQTDAAGAVAQALARLEVNPGTDLLQQAARFAAFDRLREQEQAIGFGEAPVRMQTGRFFRSGKTGGWRNELGCDQVARIEAAHGAMMRRLGYEPVNCTTPA